MDTNSKIKEELLKLALAMRYTRQTEGQQKSFKTASVANAKPVLKQAVLDI